jgi:hypothetical protein
MERLLDEDGFEIATRFVAKMINFNGETVVLGLLEALAHRNS